MANKLNAFRKKHDLTQLQLAKILGYSKSYIGTIDNGAYPVTEGISLELDNITEEQIIAAKAEGFFRLDDSVVGSVAGALEVMLESDRGHWRWKQDIREIHKQLCEHYEKNIAPIKGGKK